MTGMSNPAGRPVMSARSAAKPPQDVPTTTTWYATEGMPVVSSDLPIDLLTCVQSFVAWLVLGELEGLLAAQAEHAEPDETVVKERMHAVLQVLVEIDV